MKRRKNWVVLGMFMSGVGLFFLNGESPGPGKFETGKILDQVVCLANPEQSYALYLPSAYSPDKKWPIIYAFDPGARGSRPLVYFKAAAEKYGYIVAGSNNARNGPWEPLYQAGHAVWSDTRQRFSIDYNRIYATGFSGGGRAASTFKFIINRDAAGIISCGAGLNINLKPERLKPSVYFGIVGLADFNYREMIKLDNDLDTAGVIHGILVFDGSHQWPPEEYCTQAVEWMEMNAIKQGLREKDGKLVMDLYKEALDRAQKMEQAQNILLAASVYESTEPLFNGLVDNTELAANARRLKESQEFKQFQKAEKKRSQEELEFIGLFTRVTALLKNSPLEDIPRPKTLYRDLKLTYLQKEANKRSESTDIYDRALARRLLVELTIHAFEEGNTYTQKGDLARAGIFFEIAVQSGNEDPIMLYNLACVYSRAKDKKKALNCLKQSVKKGFTDLDLIKKDPDLDFIRQEKEFKEILQ